MISPVWWLLGLIPALVLLYFLKLKRQEIPVSSTLLWRRSLEDLHVNSPFQKLRRSLLFLLQLLALLLLITAVWRPRCDVTAPGGRNLIVFVDNSASMNAREGGETRLELARDEALSLVDSMVQTDRMLVAAFADRATTVQPLTSDRALLASRIRSIRATSRPGDLAAAISSATALAESFPAAEVYFLSDGCHGKVDALSLEAKQLQLAMVQKGSELENFAIVEADVRRTFGRVPRTEAFARVRSFAEAERELTLGLYRESTLVDARSVRLGPGEAASETFDITDLQPGVVRLEIDADDALEQDDRAYLLVSPPTTTSVLIVGEENRWLDGALLSNPSIEARRVPPSSFTSPQVQELLEEGSSPVLIFDRFTPEEPPLVPAIFIACHPPLPEGMPAPRTEELPVVIDWDRAHPVNRLLVYSTVRIAESLVFDGREGGYFRSLVESDKGPIIGVLTRESSLGRHEAAVLIGFDLLDSNWPVGHYSFPVFFTNAVTWLGQGSRAAPARWRTGEMFVHRLRERGGADRPGTVEVETPGGERLAVSFERSGRVVFGGTDEPGVYELRVDGEEAKPFCVSLLDERESDLRPRADVGAAELETHATLSARSHDLWRWFALGALAFLLSEWYVYHRRVYV